MGWRNRPRFIRSCPDDMDYIMFVDENGDDDLTNIKKCHKKGKSPDPNNIYFTITGCIIHRDELKYIKEDITKLKMKYWENGCYDYKDKLKRVCFHSREIRRHEAPFRDDDINHSDFITDLSEFLSSIKTQIVSVTINKDELCRKYSDPFNPYEISAEFIIERYSKFLSKEQSRGIVLLEKRGKKQDQDLLIHIKKILNNGTGSGERNFVDSTAFKNTVNGVYFNSKWCSQSNDTKTYFGLEIADLLSYPIHQYVRSGLINKSKSFLTLESKLNGYPNYNGYGIKVFPKI